MKKFVAIALLSAILAACGGGGGSSEPVLAEVQTKEQFIAQTCEPYGGYTDGFVSDLGTLLEQQEADEGLEHIEGRVYTKYRIYCVNRSDVVIDGHQIWPVDAYYSHLPDGTAP